MRPNQLSRYGAITRSLPMTLGKVFFVANENDAWATSLQNEFPVDSDGVQRVYIATATTANTAIQAALDACTANHDDYVLIMPSDTNYGLAAALTMSKKAVHLICPTGLRGPNLAIGNTARIKQLGSGNAVIAISAQACEVAGFYLKNYTGQSTITLATAAHAPNIHNNMFALVWSGAQAPAIAGTGQGGAWGSIEYNWFISETGTGITAAIGAIDIKDFATGARVCNNEVTIGDANIATVAISNNAVKGMVADNRFSEAGGSGVASGGTITNAIYIHPTGAAINNRGAVATGQLLSGGTASHSFSDNRDGASGGATPVEA